MQNETEQAFPGNDVEVHVILYGHDTICQASVPNFIVHRWLSRQISHKAHTTSCELHGKIQKISHRWHADASAGVPVCSTYTMRKLTKHFGNIFHRSQCRPIDREQDQSPWVFPAPTKFNHQIINTLPHMCDVSTHKCIVTKLCYRIMKNIFLADQAINQVALHTNLPS